MHGDGVNRSFMAVYSGGSTRAAQDARDRLHLILQREDALIGFRAGVQLRASGCDGISGCVALYPFLSFNITSAVSAVVSELGMC